MENNITSRIQDLEQLDISIDAPEAKSGPISVNYAWSYDSNFEDYGPFCRGLNRLLQEAMLFKHVNDVVQEGMKVHVSMLYTWRSISKPLDAIKVDENDQNEFFKSQFRVLIEPMKKLYSLSKFVDQTLVELLEMIDKCRKQLAVKMPISEGMLEAIGKIISMLMTIDNLRSTKESIRNDLSLFKRVLIVAKDKQESDLAEKISQLTIFTSQPLEIMGRLKQSLSIDPVRYKIIREVLKLHANVLEHHLFYDPHKGFELVLILLGCLTVLDQQKGLGNKLAKHKISFARLDKIFRETPAISLVGDMICKVSEMLKRTQINFDFALFDPSFMTKNESMFSIVTKIPEFQNQYLGIMSELLLAMNSSSIIKTHSGLYDLSPEDSKKLFECTTKTLKVVGNWSFTLHRLFFCKMSNPFSNSKFYGSADNVDDYSLVTRYNYSPAEKTSVSRVIFMIKSMFNFLKGRENLIISAINGHIYHMFQNFVQTTVLPMHFKFKTCKCAVFRTAVDIIKNICSDTIDVVDSKKSKIVDRVYNLHNRSVAPLSTQLYLARTMLEVVLHMKEAKKFIEGAFASQIQAFLNEGAMFSEIMNISKCLDDCSRLDTLWFKDFYIELSAGKHVQYPIEDSIPWIMISHLLKTHEPNSSEFTLYLAGIYADAADSILHKLKVRHLYDEVVSEANLVFKQLCYHLGLLIYSRRRAETFDHLIDKSSRNHICRKLGAADAKFLSESNMQFQNFQHLSNLCKQLSVQFLGGRINLNAMLCQRLQHSIKESLRHCITYFENQDIHSVILLSSLIDIYQETHVNLSKDFPLPPFETILREVNHDMPGCLPLITHQIIQYLVDDLAQNYSFSMVTERFVRSPEVLSTKPQSTPVSINLMLIYPSKAIMNLFNEQHSLYSQFVGIEHFVEIFKLVGYSGFFAIVDEIKNYISDLLAEPIKNSILTLLNTMPSSGQFPRITDGIRSVMDFFNMSFERVLRSEKMQSEVLHSFRILGNYIVIVYMLEKAVYSCEANDLFISAPLDGFFTVEPDQISLVQKSSSKSDFIKPYAFDQFPPDSIPQNLKDALDKASELNHERMNTCLPIYVSIVDFVSEQMKDAFWKGLCPQLDVVTAGSCELNRVISTIFYYISFYGLKQELSAQYIFGDGIIYGPLFLVVTLGLEDWVDVSDICCHAISASEIDLANKKQAESDYNSKKIAMKKSSFLIDGGDSSCPYTQTIASMRVLVSKRREILKFFSDKLSRLSPSKPEPLISIPPPTFVPPE